MEVILSPRVFRCRECHHHYRDFVIDEKRFYQEYRERHEPYPVEIRRSFCFNLVGIISPLINQSDSVLELGSGDGYFAKCLRGISDNVECCELDDNLADNLKLMGFEVHNKHLLNLSDDLKFDVVVAIDVLEHIKDLQRFAEKFSKISKRLIIQVPVKRKIHQRYPFDGHYHYFSPESITKLFEEYYDVKVMIKETGKKTVANNPEMIVVFDRRQE